MPKLSRLQKRRYISFIIILTAAFIYGGMNGIKLLNDISSQIYMGLIIGWGLALKRRITDERMRKLFVLLCDLMILLFILRIIKYNVVGDTVGMYVWCLYYIPFTSIPLIAFLIARSIYEDRDKKWYNDVIYRIFAVVQAFVIIVTVTTPKHGLVLDMHPAAYNDSYTYGPLYYFIVGVEFFYTISAFIVLMRQCRISAARRYWWVPGIPTLFFTFLAVIYMINGGIDVGGLHIYKIQEVFCLIFVSFIEGSIAIGLIPSNSQYEELFEASDINAAILNNGSDNGLIIYRSKGFDMLMREDEMMSSSGCIGYNGTGEGYGDSEKEGYIVSNNHSFKKNAHEIPGGRVIWFTDMQAVNRLNDELRGVIEELSSENEIARYEYEEQVKRERLKTRNALFDNMAAYVRPQIDEIENTLENNGDIRWAVILGAYIKRRINLAIITDRKKLIPLEELKLSILESFEYMGLSDIYTSLKTNDGRSVPLNEPDIEAEYAAWAYDVFEQIVELTYNGMQTIEVILYLTDALFSMKVSIAGSYDKLEDFIEVIHSCKDSKISDIATGTEGYRDHEISAKAEDDTLYVLLKCRRNGGDGHA